MNIARPQTTMAQAVELAGDAWDRIRWTELHHMDLHSPTGRKELEAQLAELGRAELEAMWFSLEVQVRLLHEAPELAAWIKAGGWTVERALARIAPALMACGEALDRVKAAGGPIPIPRPEPAPGARWYEDNPFVAPSS